MVSPSLVPIELRENRLGIYKSVANSYSKSRDKKDDRRWVSSKAGDSGTQMVGDKSRLI